jgi:phytoene dehydrogenase-like protein
VIATDAPTAARLTSLTVPEEPMGVSCVYFAGTTSLYSGPKLLLNANPIGFVNNAVQISNVSPAYAPAGQHLLSASVLTAGPMDEADLVARCRMDLSSWFPEKAFATYRPVGTYRIPFAQFRQPPGIFKQAPANTTPTVGLFLAGEYTESSSIQGAMLSGERAAAAVLDALRAEEK